MNAVSTVTVKKSAHLTWKIKCFFCLNDHNDPETDYFRYWTSVSNKTLQQEEATTWESAGV